MARPAASPTPRFLRALARDPVSMAVAVLTLSIGIGASIAMYAVLDAVVLKDLPVAESRRVVVLWGEVKQQQFAHLPVSLAEAEEFARAPRSLGSTAAVDYNGAWDWLIDEGEGGTNTIRVGPVSGDFFAILGARAFLGRLLEPADALRGAEPVIVLSYRYWQAHYGGDRGVIGRVMRERVQGRPLTIVGVAPPGFLYPAGAEAWASLRYWHPSDSTIYVDVVGRLTAGATVDDVGAEFEVFLRERAAGFDAARRQVTAVAKTLPDAVAGDLQRPVWLLTAAVGLVLLIAAANGAGILLLRSAARGPELALRRALGASRRHLLALVFSEAVGIGAVASALGIAVAAAAVGALPLVAPTSLPRVADAAINGRVLVPAVLIGLLTALLSGLAPALWVLRSAPAPRLVATRSIGGASPAAVRWRRRLVVGQIGLTVLTVAAAGLLLRSFVRLSEVDLGYREPQLLQGRLSAPLAKLDISDTTSGYYDLLDLVLERLRRLPGIEGVTAMVNQPFAGTGGMDGRLTAEGQTGNEPTTTPWLNMEVVGPDYFRVMGIGLLSGRPFAPTDRRGAVPVVIVSEAAAKAFWPGQDPLGKRIGFPNEWRTVVGVAPETRYRELVAPRPTIYYPYRQTQFSPPTYLTFRASVASQGLGPAIRSAIREVDPELGLVGPSTMRSLTAAPMAGPRFQAALSVAFAAIALLLAGIGIYGVATAMVRLRSGEIGIRMALGASAPVVIIMVLRSMLGLAALGAGLGVLAAVATGRALRSLLFEISPTDPTVIGLAAVVVLGVAVAGSAIPAKTAAGIDPMTSLRAE